MFSEVELIVRRMGLSLKNHPRRYVMHGLYGLREQRQAHE
nr:MAG TPA: hypothetical protein [Caudoviricetes sp.]